MIQASTTVRVSGGLRILYIAPMLPWPATLNGSGQRTELLLRALRQCGEVDFIFNPGAGYPGLESLDAGELRRTYGVTATFVWPPTPQRGPWATVGRTSTPVAGVARVLADQAGWAAADPALASWVKQAVRERGYDLIVTRYLRSALLAGLRDVRVPFIVDADDVDWLKLRWMIEASGAEGRTLKRRAVDGLRVWNLRRLCRSALRRASHVWVTNEHDRQQMGLGHATVLPNIPYHTHSAVGVRHCCQAGPRALFIGGLAYEPNRDGLDRFLRQVWPTVKASVPDASLDVVGGGLDEATRQRWSAIRGVNLLGAREDLASCFDDAAFTIAPVDWGGGTKIKVIESYTFGRPCVVTPHALWGYEHAMRHGREVWLARTDEQFATGCVRLMREPTLRRMLADRGAAAVREHFSWARFNETVQSAVQSVCGVGGSSGVSAVRAMEAVTP